MKVLKDRLQFVITLALFFPVVLDSLLGLGSNPSNSNETVLKWGVVIAALIFDYLVIEIKEFEINKKLEVILDKLLLIEIFMFALISFIFAALFQNGSISTFYKWLLEGSLIGVVIIPIIILICLVGNLGSRVYELISKDISKK